MQVGNRNQAPKSKPWRWFRDLNQQYGACQSLTLSDEERD